jgi:anti-anti-sigma factor
MAELGDNQAADIAVDTSTDSSGAAVVTVAGQLDISNADTLDAAVATAVAAHPQKLIFDLSGLEFMDSAGIAVLIRATSDVEAVRLRNPSPIVRRLIEVTGLSGILQSES